jgi:hypothetical protein
MLIPDIRRVYSRPWRNSRPANPPIPAPYGKTATDALTPVSCLKIPTIGKSNAYRWTGSLVAQRLECQRVAFTKSVSFAQAAIPPRTEIAGFLARGL